MPYADGHPDNLNDREENAAKIADMTPIAGGQGPRAEGQKEAEGLAIGFSDVEPGAAGAVPFVRRWVGVSVVGGWSMEPKGHEGRKEKA